MNKEAVDEMMKTERVSRTRANLILEHGYSSNEEYNANRQANKAIMLSNMPKGTEKKKAVKPVATPNQSKKKK